MKYFKVLFCLILLILVGITGCSSKEEVTSINTVDVKELKDHSGTYVGDNSNVVAIVRALPGGETFKEIDLHNKTLKITYGTKAGSLSEDETLKYWFDGKNTLEKNFLYNAIYLTILVPNAQGYSFKVDNQNFSVSREEMEQFISDNIKTLPDSNKLFDKEKTQQFIDDNKEKINKTVKSPAIREKIFKSAPIVRE
ncbi:DUF4825 domain-containing protein [Priestia aryabhattai]|uniref:DUF4825 domain-containing protein n=1 Tax=Priestia aryabhattai TaxID=412384 RepID=UPI000B506BCB|nr:DUF4825 domain-containing protein [Priestia aryabhattai]MBZ6484280.1 DUF4825 domain-containing protein [Priestia aryabhattai]MDH3115341.1 DUF4825 domain-containing protein [Priestia aryabhattai]MDH3125767.1 DUF4825 domain-containing protein [Priestia aryabhattai]MDH3134018.1 DUF4825 domain-containing protein [Priestia aryabhattai]MED4154889.1 DUF4825 domain-containing protein [Priestia aryabhattai]